MSMWTMPTPPADNRPSWECRVTLVDSEYVFVFKPQQRRRRYSLDIRTIDGVWLIRGLAMCTNVDLFKRIPDPPPGQLFVYNIDGSIEAPFIGDWDTKARLYWVPPVGVEVTS